MPTPTPARRAEILPTTDHRDKSILPLTGSPWPRIAGAYADVHDTLGMGSDTFRAGDDTHWAGDDTHRAGEGTLRTGGDTLRVGDGTLGNWLPR